MRVVITPSEPADDPVRQLLGGAPDPLPRLGLRHWLGVLGLVAAIAVAAFVVPPLLAPATPPASRSVVVPVTSAPPHPVLPPSPPGTAPTSPATAAPTARPTRTAGPTWTGRPPWTGWPAPGGVVTKPPTPPGWGGFPTRFRPVTLQAENGSLSDGADAVDCGTCSAGARVRYVGRVDVPARIPFPGTYDVTVVYEVDGSRSLGMSIDDTPVLTSRKVSGSDWTTPLRLTLRAALPAGLISIGFNGSGGNAPDIDAVTIA
jgi:hypothetical protein